MPELDRVHQNTPLTVSRTWTEDGAYVDPGTVTIGITRADGTVLVAPGAATSASTPPASAILAVRSFNLTTTHTALLDRLEVTWTSTLKGTLISYVEVVGGFLFTIAQAKAIRELTTQTPATIAEYRTLVEDEIEGAIGYALVPRYHEETFSGDGGLALFSRRSLTGHVPRTNIPFVTTVRAVTVDGAAVSAADVTPDPAGFYYASAWTSGRDNIVVRYEHGAKMLPPGATRVGLILLKSWLGGQNRPIDDRAITFSSNEAGTYSLAVPGRNGSTFGHPDVDAWVANHDLSVGVA